MTTILVIKGKQFVKTENNLIQGIIEFKF